jgi:hypothetical protein
MQGYSTGSVGPFIPVHYNGSVESYMQAIVMSVWGPS